jgi:hypothetical protein
MLAEFSRVLTDDGVLVLSAPNRPEYSESRGYVNPYHRHEHDRAELERLLRVTFPAIAWHAQRVWLGSTVWREGGGAMPRRCRATRRASTRRAFPRRCISSSSRRAARPRFRRARLRFRLFSDAGETELKRAAASAAEAIRLDGLLKARESVVVERDAQLARAHGHVKHLEGLLAKRDPLLAERERIVEERDAQLQEVVRAPSASKRSSPTRDALLATANAHVATSRSCARSARSSWSIGTRRSPPATRRSRSAKARRRARRGDRRSRRHLRARAALAKAADEQAAPSGASRGRAPTTCSRGSRSPSSRPSARASTARSRRRSASSTTGSRCAGGSALPWMRTRSSHGSGLTGA